MTDSPPTKAVAYLDDQGRVVRREDRGNGGFFRVDGAVPDSWTPLFPRLPLEPVAKDCAAEDGHNLCAAVEAYMEASNEMASAADMGDFEPEDGFDPQGYQDAVSDCWQGMESAVHQFRKRTPKQSPTKEGN